MSTREVVSTGKITGGAGKVVLATRNLHKVDELVEAFAWIDLAMVSLAVFRDAPEVEEDGDTFEANARKKARAIADYTGCFALADDSGLCVDALDGVPGVRSARFAGESATDADNRAELLRRLKGVTERGAEFVCVLVLADPNGGEFAITGRCRGAILWAERGHEGFGYDSLFLPEGEERTFAEMTRAEKARLSHRGRAIQAARAPFRAALEAGRV
ncbi:MAG: RdgB/HAM1 family non-canonical purine NTP pyrophosphatase [bacterium]